VIFRNLVISCELSAIPKFDLNAWKDEDLSVELPVTRDTLAKVIDLAKFNVEERNRREKQNVAQSKNLLNISVAAVPDFLPGTGTGTRNRQNFSAGTGTSTGTGQNFSAGTGTSTGAGT
jgi:hypothetical protein